MARIWIASRNLRTGAVSFTFVLVVGACGSGAHRAGSNEPRAAVSSTTEFQGTPTLTIPGLVAPPRSYKPVFTGAAAEVERAFRARLDAFERKDVAAAIVSQSSTGASRAELLGFMNTYRIRLYRINAIAVNGNTASIEYENAIVGRNLKANVITTLLGQRETWIKHGERWQSVSDVSSSPGLPSDLASVTMTLRDHAPILLPARLPKTDFGFLVKNTGAAAKGLFILGIPADLNVASFLPVIEAIGTERQTNTAASEFPDGVLEMGATADIPAHKDGTMVFSGRLPKGRYLLVSRSAEGARDQPLPAKEYTDFTIN